MGEDAPCGVRAAPGALNHPAFWDDVGAVAARRTAQGGAAREKALLEKSGSEGGVR